MFAYGAISRGVAYINAPSSSYTMFVDAVVPLKVCAFVWIGAGLLMLAGIWHRVVARWALSFGGSLWAVWGLSFYLSWIIGEQSRAWVTAGGCVTIAGIMFIVAALADSVGPPGEPVMAEQ